MPTAWSRGSTSAIGCWRSRKGATPRLTCGRGSIPYPDASFDAAVSTQVLEYVADVPTALAELRRVVRPGGRILILENGLGLDCVAVRRQRPDGRGPGRVGGPSRGPAAAASAARRAPLGRLHTGHSARTALLKVGFDPVRAFSAGLIDIIGDFIAERGVLPAAEVAAWKADLRSLGDGYFFSLNRYVFRAIRA